MTNFTFVLFPVNQLKKEKVPGYDKINTKLMKDRAEELRRRFF